MASLDTETISVSTRTQHGSRAMRRLRRAGRVPAVIYGGDGEPQAIEVDARTLRNAIAHAGALLQLSVDGGGATPVQIKDVQRHGVRGDILHADFYRVRMDRAIQAAIPVEVAGTDDAPGVVEGGVLMQDATTITVEALPGDMPETVTVDVSGMEMNATLTLADVPAPRGMSFVDAPDTVIATITPPTQEPTEEEIETETAVVGAEGEAEAGKAEGDTGEEAEAVAGSEQE
jgi:large subunit ribosomal protein L25